jgi:hypothetical protein
MEFFFTYSFRLHYSLGLTQSLTDTSASYIPGCRARPARKADNLSFICEPIVYKMCEPLLTLEFSTTCYADSVLLLLALASKMNLGPESHGTQDRILLSHDSGTLWSLKISSSGSVFAHVMSCRLIG